MAEDHAHGPGQGEDMDMDTIPLKRGQNPGNRRPSAGSAGNDAEKYAKWLSQPVAIDGDEYEDTLWFARQERPASLLYYTTEHFRSWRSQNPEAYRELAASQNIVMAARDAARDANMAASSSHMPSSPRLPSPPPFPEVQMAPESPLTSAPPNFETASAPTHTSGAQRRIRPGTKAEDMTYGPPVAPLPDLDSAYQLQEHLMAMYQEATQTQKGKARYPITHEKALELAQPPGGVNKHLWLYELCRLLVEKTNNVVCALFFCSPACSALSCPEMRASEWQYLCASHEPPHACSAIDYSTHTLDWAANVLTSPKYFPSRLTMGDDPGTGRESYRHLVNIFRRVYRIYAHAWHAHRDVFWQVESQYGHYVFYKTVCDLFGLIPEDSYTIPPEAEGIETPEQGRNAEFDLPAESSQRSNESPVTPEAAHPAAGTTLSTGAAVRKHRHTPSTGSLVPRIEEGDEDADVGAEGGVFAASGVSQGDFGGSTSGPHDTPVDTTALLNTVRHDPAGSPQKGARSPKKSSGGGLSSPTRMRFFPVEAPIEEMAGLKIGADSQLSGESASTGAAATHADEEIVVLPSVEPLEAHSSHRGAGDEGPVDRVGADATSTEAEEGGKDDESDSDTVILLPTDDFGNTIQGTERGGDEDGSDAASDAGTEIFVGNEDGGQEGGHEAAG